MSTATVSTVPARPAPAPVRPSTAWTAGGPALVALVVMLIGIGDRQLWRDEHATWWAASLPLGDLTQLVRIVDLVLAPYYLAMHFWVVVSGDSAFAMRLPSALCAAAAAGLLALIGRRIADAWTGIIAGLLLAAVPAVSRYGQEARPYAPALLATVAAVLLLLRAVESPSRWRWLGYGLAVAAVAATHLVALLAVPAHLVLDRRLTRGRLLAMAGALAVAAPLAFLAHRQAHQISWVPDPSWAGLAAFPGKLFLSTPVAVVLIGLGLVAMLRRSGAFLAGWALLPPVLTALTAHQLHFFYPRYLLFTVPAWALAAAWTLRRWIAHGPLITVAVLVVAALGVPAQRLVRSDAVQSEVAYAAGARYLGAHEQPGDGVMYTGYPRLFRGFAYELGRDGRPIPREVLTTTSRGRAWWWNREACPDVTACLSGVRRLWLVAADPRRTVLNDLDPAARSGYTVTETRTFHRLRISLLEAKP
ncbi:glycosyltransferase family 39 protein [Micromonosporaceae bacterium Da 78-11]